MSFRRALSFSYIEKYGSYAISLASTVVISRMLGPADVGVFAVGMALVGIVAVLREFGISTYIIQEPELTDNLTSAAFTLASGVGLSLALVVLILSFPAGLFYDDPRVTHIILILSIGFLTTPFGSISQAIMSRHLLFGALAWIRLLYSVVTGVTAIGLLALGLGPESLAWATVAAGLVNAVVSMRIQPHPLALRFVKKDLARVFSIGGPATIIAILDDLTSALPELLLGRIQNLASAGLFSRARGLSQMAHQLVARAAGPVFLAAFSELARDQQSAKPLYIKATECVTLVGWMFLGILGLLAKPIVILLFGEGWLEILPALRWLCLSAAILLITSGAHHLLMANGGVKELLRAKAIGLCFQLVCLVFGAFIGIEAMAIAMVMGSLAASTLLCVAVQRKLGIHIVDQLSSIRTSLPIILVSGLGTIPAFFLPVDFLMRSVAMVIVGTLGASLVAFGLLAASGHPLKYEVQRMFAKSLEKKGS